ncbi:hypothetical protein L1987_38453 [Smallanthus sonchifolius]|uniref:Uncharacterized protein n=1 Tax=Smallanthus sonchifolius TaxID=185202 RepID=A0ACB9HJ05_9ASTR|nr:hypothetical protein L1987_38453 [Smallanthus sonchifolius]
MVKSGLIMVYIQFETRCTMALGLVKRTSSFGRKRVFFVNEMDIEGSIDAISPTKKRSIGDGFSSERSLIEALPQDVIIKVLCGVEHDDLKRLFHVSKAIREAAMIAKKQHFAYSTPTKVPAFRCSIDQPDQSDVDEVEAPNAPKQSRVARSRLDRNKMAELSVALFASDEDEGWSRKNLCL